MRKDDLCITVPTFFRCPISLDVMKSPVSLCTGVTYDRASIQRWLDGGNNTCPATMQILQNKDFIPNRTLQRLIEIWSDSVRRRACVESSAELAAPTRDEISDAIDRVKIEKEDRDDREVLSKIVRFGRESDDNRGFLAGKDDFVRLLVDLIDQVGFETTSAAKSLVVQEAVKILSLVRTKISDRRRFSNLILTNGRDRLTVIVFLFRTGNVELKIDCAGLLEFIAVDAESKLLIAERDGLVTELMRSISKDSDSSLIESSLSCLIAISSPKRVKLNLIREKLIGDVTKLLSDPTASSVSVTEKCLKLLEILASTKEGRSEICGGDGECLKTVVKKLMKVSTAATEHAVTVLWSVSYLFKEDKALEAVTSANGVTKILLLLQSNCSPAVRRMLTDLLKVFKVNSRSCLSAYDTKTTHIMPF
ncbi:PREDICTED: U-box domain-containing protein 27 [Camelina sativa]|uniref:U-box domain-containing protein n=1 Tax=Camelina sativa TaxID=90675 RepID=A0ABM0VY59_CAMSA|nr:PREDICTED: U-box domain-containing protein 27 [Camelina sativa]